MEVKINKEIRDYTEAIFFGLSLRQFIFSGLACGIAVGLYFLLHPYMSMETVSWICVLGAAPCVVFGFVKYHGMTAEQFIWAWIKSEILMPKKLVFRSENLYFDAVLLNGNAAGVSVTSNGMDRMAQLSSVRVRGTTSIVGGNEVKG